MSADWSIKPAYILPVKTIVAASRAGTELIEPEQKHNCLYRVIYHNCVAMAKALNQMLRTSVFVLLLQSLSNREKKKIGVQQQVSWVVYDFWLFSVLHIFLKKKISVCSRAHVREKERRVMINTVNVRM